MKRILITGANSYIGTSVEKFLSQWPHEYHVDTIDMVDGSWRQESFSDYDSVFHVAGIAHQDSGKITQKRKQLYYKVNTDLTIAAAEKAKAEGVTQFVFMSSIIVYGLSARMGEKKIITPETKPASEGAYGDSKLQAEMGIQLMSNSDFRVCVLRPPMIYGPNCKGNYPTLSKVARSMPLFPNVQNERSILFVGNLCIYIKHVIDLELSGIHFPQNPEYVCTSAMVSEIADAHGKHIRLTKVFNPILRMLSGNVKVIDKVFGNLAIEKSDKQLVGMVGLRESILLTEGVVA